MRIQEILLILVVLLLLFGATRLPQLGASLGSAIRNFKRGFTGEEPPADDKKDDKKGGSSSLASGDRLRDDEVQREKKGS